MGPPRLMNDWLLILALMVMAAGFGADLSCSPDSSARTTPRPKRWRRTSAACRAVGDARERQSVKFYLVAMIFLLFDIEVAFLYPWAMALRELGWAGFVQVVLFIAVLVAGYVYVWRKGALDWSQR